MHQTYNYYSDQTNNQGGGYGKDNSRNFSNNSINHSKKNDPYNPHQPNSQYINSGSQSSSVNSPDKSSQEVLQRVFDEQFSLSSSSKLKLQNYMQGGGGIMQGADQKMYYDINQNNDSEKQINISQRENQVAANLSQNSSFLSNHTNNNNNNLRTQNFDIQSKIMSTIAQNLSKLSLSSDQIATTQSNSAVKNDYKEKQVPKNSRSGTGLGGNVAQFNQMNARGASNQYDEEYINTHHHQQHQQQQNKISGMDDFKNYSLKNIKQNYSNGNNNNQNQFDQNRNDDQGEEDPETYEEVQYQGDLENYDRNQEEKHIQNQTNYPNQNHYSHARKLDEQVDDGDNNYNNHGFEEGYGEREGGEQGDEEHEEEENGGEDQQDQAEIADKVGDLRNENNGEDIKDNENQNGEGEEGVGGALGQQDEQDEEDSNEFIFKAFDSCYKVFLGKIAREGAFVNGGYQQQISMLINYFTDSNLDLRIGSLIFLFELIYNFRDSLNEDSINLLLSQLYSNIPLYYQNQDFYMVYCVLEIIALIGPHTLSYNNIKIVASILMDESLTELQEKSFLALVNFDYPGFYSLLDLANQDFNNINLYIMNKFAATDQILLSVILPSLLNDINIGDQKKQISSMNALNRMGDLIWKSGALPILLNLMNQGLVDRQLIASTIRACGEVGQQTLLKLLKTTPNEQIKTAIISVLSWAPPQTPQRLKVKVIKYQVATHYNINPGTMCIYHGSLVPLVFESEMQTQDNENFIEVNERDFMAAMQRLLSVQFEKFQNSPEKLTRRHDVRATGLVREFTLAKLIDPSLSEEQAPEECSKEVLKGLCLALTTDSANVREAALTTIGTIGNFAVNYAQDFIFRALSDNDSNVRTSAVWCIGKLSPQDNIQHQLVQQLIDMLQDNYWKVRTTACVSIGNIGQRLGELAFPVLSKILRDGTINQQTVCETFVRLGIYGEQILIDLLQNVPLSNFKLKAAIIQAFMLADVSRPTIDFIIQELFQNAKQIQTEIQTSYQVFYFSTCTYTSDPMIQVRQACLQTLEVLRNKAHDTNITYLKSRNILPLFYFFLQDSSAEIRQIALESIQTFGPQAQFIFIQGLTKDKNPSIRCECARGLASMGIQNFRVLLFGLRDIDENVRKSTALAINKYFSKEMIFNDYENQKDLIPSLLVTIQEILDLPFYMQQRARDFLVQILQMYEANQERNIHDNELGYQKKSSNGFNYNFSNNINNNMGYLNQSPNSGMQVVQQLRANNPFKDSPNQGRNTTNQSAEKDY